jgi:hypothetical protein
MTVAFPLARRRATRNVRVSGVTGLAASLLWLVTGCQAPAPPTGPTEMTLHVADYEAFFDASLSTLRLYDFPPDRVDRVRGLIVSHPTTSGQWFEWWRVDSRGGYQTLESSLHTMRRIVTVNIEPAGAQATTGPAAQPGAPPTEDLGLNVAQNDADIARSAHTTTGPTPEGAGGLYRLRVQVEKSRFTAPERQITTTSGVLAIYSDRVPNVEGQRGPQSRYVQWVPLGRDGLLESFLLAKLSEALPDVTPAE